MAGWTTTTTTTSTTTADQAAKSSETRGDLAREGEKGADTGQRDTPTRSPEQGSRPGWGGHEDPEAHPSQRRLAGTAVAVAADSPAAAATHGE